MFSHYALVFINNHLFCYIISDFFVLVLEVELIKYSALHESAQERA